jgi:hypothetical protein
MTLTFRWYLWGLGDTDMLVNAVDWDGYVPDASDIITAVGMDPNMDDDEIVVGVLARPWNSYPAGAFVVSGPTAPGLPFAVSTTLTPE